MLESLIRWLLGFFGDAGVARRHSQGKFDGAARDAFAEYWIGKGVDYKRLWAIYDAGQGYIQKFKSQKEVYLIAIEFNYPSSQIPLFDHEAVFKTLKGLFHDLKQTNLSSTEYDEALPLFLYSVERGSGIYKFLGELRQLLMFGTILSDEKIMQAHLDVKQQRIDFLRANFPNVSAEEARRLVMAKTTIEMDEALNELMKGGVSSVKISAQPVPHTLFDKSDLPMIELKGRKESD